MGGKAVETRVEVSRQRYDRAPARTHACARWHARHGRSRIEATGKIPGWEPGPALYEWFAHGRSSPDLDSAGSRRGGHEGVTPPRSNRRSGTKMHARGQTRRDATISRWVRYVRVGRQEGERVSTSIGSSPSERNACGWRVHYDDNSPVWRETPLASTSKGRGSGQAELEANGIWTG